MCNTTWRRNSPPQIVFGEGCVTYCRNFDAGPLMNAGERSSRKKVCTDDKPDKLDIILSMHVGGSACALLRISIEILYLGRVFHQMALWRSSPCFAAVNCLLPDKTEANKLLNFVVRVEASA